ncbi:MAG: argininosuccinate lyase, partial [Chloroflexi bacterium]|nr:argininosuccinate lyase [Chloroflexota bacterium]
YMLATDVADYLVGKGMPFREAHAVVGKLVRHAVALDKPLLGLSLDELKAFSPKFDRDVFEISVATSIAARDVPGGTAPRRVEEALKNAVETLRSEA